MKVYQLAWLSLIRHPYVTFITLISMALSIASAGTLIKIYQLSEARFSTIPKEVDAVVGAKASGIDILLNSLNGEGGYPGFIPFKLFESLRAGQTVMHGDGKATTPTAIRNIIPFVYFAKFGPYRVIGSDDSFAYLLNADNPKTLFEGHWPSEIDQVVVGYQIAKKHKLNLGQVIQVNPWLPDNGTYPEIELKVVGIMPETFSHWDRVLVGSMFKAFEVFKALPESVHKKSIWKTDALNYFLLQIYPNSFSELSQLINQRTVGQVIDVTQQKKELQKMTSGGKKLGLLFVAFILLLGALTVASTLFVRFESLSSQIAILRSIGYSQTELSLWLFFQAMGIFIAGIVIALLIEGFSFVHFRQFLGAALPPDELVPIYWFDSWQVWIVAFVTVLISMVFPMIRMARQDTNQSLRGN